MVWAKTRKKERNGRKVRRPLNCLSLIIFFVKKRLDKDVEQHRDKAKRNIVCILPARSTHTHTDLHKLQPKWIETKPSRADKEDDSQCSHTCQNLKKKTENNKNLNVKNLFITD